MGLVRLLRGLLRLSAEQLELLTGGRGVRGMLQSHLRLLSSPTVRPRGHTRLVLGPMEGCCRLQAVELLLAALVAVLVVLLEGADALCQDLSAAGRPSQSALRGRGGVAALHRRLALDLVVQLLLRRYDQLHCPQQLTGLLPQLILGPRPRLEQHLALLHLHLLGLQLLLCAVQLLRVWRAAGARSPAVTAPSSSALSACR